MRQDDWQATPSGAQQNTLGCLLDDTAGKLLLLFNRGADAQNFVLPPGRWRMLCDTAADASFAAHTVCGCTTLAGRSVQWLAQD